MGFGPSGKLRQPALAAVDDVDLGASRGGGNNRGGVRRRKAAVDEHGDLLAVGESRVGRLDLDGSRHAGSRVSRQDMARQGRRERVRCIRRRRRMMNSRGDRRRRRTVEHQARLKGKSESGIDRCASGGQHGGGP